MLMVLPSGPAKSLRFASEKRWNSRSISARQADQRVPRAIHREIVAARINHRHFSPEFGHGAQHFQLAREKLLVHHRKLDVFFNGLRAADADAEIIDVAAQHAPGMQPRRARRQRAVEAGSRPSSLGAAWRANGSASADDPARLQTCFPSPIRIRPGVSGDHPADSASRSFIAELVREILLRLRLAGARQRTQASNPRACRGGDPSLP